MQAAALTSLTSLVDWAGLLASINRCTAVYEEDDSTAREAFAALGCTVLSRVSTAEHQAVVHIDPDGYKTLTISGTRVSDGTIAQKSTDLFADLHFASLGVGQGARVATGAYDGMEPVFALALRFLEPGERLRVEGHSLGGQRTHLAPLFVPLAQLDRMIAWAPPKLGNDIYYELYDAWFDRCVTVVNKNDPWAAWPWLTTLLQHPPKPLLHLHDDGWDAVPGNAWLPTEYDEFSSHTPTAYQTRISGFCTG